MTPWQWATRPIRRYVDFKGRSPRREFWWFTLLWAVVVSAAMTVDRLAFNVSDPKDLHPTLMLAVFGLLLPHLGVIVRRYHDLGRRGWRAVVLVVPYVGWLWFVIDMATPGELEENRFGEPPYGPAAQHAPLAEPVIRSR